MIIKSMFLLGMLLTAANAPLTTSKTKITSVNNDAMYEIPFDSNRVYDEIDVPKEVLSAEELDEMDEVEDGFNPVLNGKIINCGIGGRFTYIDDYGAQIPMVGAKVEIWGESTNEEGETVQTLVRTVYLDDNGQFIMPLPRRMPAYVVPYFLKIFAAGENTKVTTTDNVEYVYTTQVRNFYAAMVNFSEVFSTNDAFGKAVSVSEAAISAARFAKHLNNDTPIADCTILYPGTSTGSYYSTNKISISNRTDSANSRMPKAYASWDVIGHEYGHHVQRTFGITANPGGTHYVGHNASDDFYDGASGITKQTPANARRNGVNLAYAEGWASAYSMLSQEYNAGLFDDVYTFADGRYDSYNGVAIDYRAYTYKLGEASEDTVCTFLYNLYDSNEDGDIHDNLETSFETWWYCSTHLNPKTFSSFVSNAFYSSGNDWDDIGSMLQYLNVAPTGIAHGEKWFTNVGPTFTWIANGGSKHFYNNKFRFEIYDEDGQDWFEDYVRISSDGKTASITIDDDIWTDILADMPGDQVFIRVAGSADWYDFETGEYFAPMVAFDKPTETGSRERHIEVAPNEWGFKEQYFFTTNATGTNKETELDKGGYLIFTDRIRCATIDNKYVVLSPKRQKAGSAYFQLTFDDSVNSVNFETALWSSSEGINKNNSTIVVYTMDINGNWNQDMDLWNDVTLPVKENGLVNLKTNNNGPIWGIKIAMTSPATGSKNTGRLALGNITINHD